MARITFKGNPVNTNGELPKIGEKAPDFRLVNGDLEEKTLEDFKGKRLLISFVPSLDTPVCSLSMKKFNEALKAHPELATVIISCDLPFAQKRICGQEMVSHVVTLSMMRDKNCAQEYGVLMQDGPLKGLCARAVLVLDEQSRVIYTELVPEIAQEPQYDKVLQMLLV